VARPAWRRNAATLVFPLIAFRLMDLALSKIKYNDTNTAYAALDESNR